MYGALFKPGGPYNAGYTSTNPEVMAYCLRMAQERDSRFNNEEQRVYDDTRIELEYGSDFFRRAHP